LLYAIVGFFVVPRIARGQIEKQARAMLHREATVSRVRFNPFALSAVIEGLDLKDRDNGALLHIDRLSADFEASGIFRRAWRFREIVIAGPHVVARIAADGRLSVADLFERKEEAPAKPPTALPRLIVDRFRVQGGAAEFVDESRTPRFVEAVSPLDLELHGLTTIPDVSGDHSITLGLEQGARIRWSGRQTVEPLRFEGQVAIDDIRLPRLWNYLDAAIPLEMREGRADLSCSYDLRKGADGGFSVAVKDARLAVRELAIRPRAGGDDWLTVPLVEVLGAEVLWPESHVEVRGIRVQGLHLLAWLEKNGTVNWQAALPTAAAAPTTDAPSAQASKPWTAKIGAVELQGASAHFEDRSFEPSIVVDLSELGVKLDNVTADPKAPIPASLEARINGGAELQASGTIVPNPSAAELAAKLSGLDLAPFARYALKMPGVELRRGAVGAEGRIRVGPGTPRLQYDGRVELTGLQVAGGGTDRLVACDRATVDGARVSVLPTKVRVAKVGLDGAFVKLDIDREGKVNLREVFAAKGAPAATPPQAPDEPVPVAIGSVAIRNARAEYTDESVILPFGTKIHTINGSIKDLSTTSAAPATLALEGRISDTGYFKADGTMRIGAPLAATDATVVFRDVALPELTPYSAQFAGYSIETGTLDVDIHYRVKDGRLVGDHRVVAKDLTLGSKVEGAKPPGLPVRLAIALLKDKDGRIDVDVPIEGTIDSPEFNYRSVFWQALKTIFANVAKAPFRAIGHLFGADQEELELVGFPSGRSDLPAPEQEKLQKMAAELSKKAELALEIEGRYDPVLDADAIRRARLDQRIDAKREAGADVESIMEKLYAESFSPERLEAERQKFTPETQAGLHDALRSQLLEAQDVPKSDLEDLARARATAIATALTGTGGLDASRVKVQDPAPVKRKKQGSELVASELTLSAGD
jgi:uncharacterized protein involved in outer membrane biogenesis